MDIFTTNKRSEIMSKIRSKNNISTEIKLISLFREFKIKGWRRNFKAFGKPDFVFPKQKIAIFVDGCFWHGCKICKRNLTSSSNRQYWEKKIETNRKRDSTVNRALRLNGWIVIRIRECQLKKNSSGQIRRIHKALAK